MALTETSPGELTTEHPAEIREPVPPSFGVGAGANDHKVVGTVFLVIALVALVAGGVLALLLRAQLAGPDGDLLSDRAFRTALTYHGTILVFLFLLPAWIGVATAVVPLQIGAARLAFPRLQAMTMWLTLVGAALVVLSAFAPGGRGLVTGWTFDSPIPERAALRGDAVELLLIGLAVALIAATLAAANLVTTVLQLRVEGLTTLRLPLFTWSFLVSGLVVLLAAPLLVSALGMVFVDHHYGARLFGGLTSSRGGNPLLWPRLVWFGLYPLLWALVLPALGVICEVVTVFAGRPIADRNKALGAFGAVGALAFFGWGSEVRNLPRGRLIFVLGALAVLAAAASLILNLLLTLRKAAQEGGTDRLSRGLTAPPLMLAGGALLVLAAGLGASAVSALDAGGASHGNYWSVGQQHLLFFLPATLAVVAAAHFWGPRIWGRHLSAPLGRLEALLLTGGGLLGFLPALLLGAAGMDAGTSSFDSRDGWGLGNLAMSAGAAVIALGVVVFVLDLLVSTGLRRGRPAEADPWGGHTLEWTAPAPLPPHNFDHVPEVRSPHPALDLRGER